jgi:hypothetical protein
VCFQQGKKEGFMEKVKIKIMASQDWSMRFALEKFVEFADPVIRYKGKEYKIELGRIKADPITCGQNLNDQADVVIDRTIHWNEFYKAWAQTAQNCQMRIANSPLTFSNLDKHSTFDLMARSIHSKDRFPTTVLIPEFYPYTDEHWKNEMWSYEQIQIIRNTKFGWDPNRRTTDWAKVQQNVKRMQNHISKGQLLREQFYPSYNYLAEVMEKHFNNQFPVYMKKCSGGGGANVHKIKSIEELYQKYDESEGVVYHIQEAIEDYDMFIRSMALGPQVHPMIFQPDEPLHQHYSPELLKVDPEIYERMETYVQFVNSYHRWTYNSFECLIKNGQIHPIDFANACPDSNFTSLHTHFPWLICALLKWMTFIAVTKKDMGIDLEQEKYLKVFNDPKKSQEDKYRFNQKMSRKYFETEKFEEFCAENFSDIESKMLAFFDEKFDSVIEFAIEYSDFPDHEKGDFYSYYKNMMDTIFRPNADSFLKTVVFK